MTRLESVSEIGYAFVGGSRNLRIVYRHHVGKGHRTVPEGQRSESKTLGSLGNEPKNVKESGAEKKSKKRLKKNKRGYGQDT